MKNMNTNTQTFNKFAYTLMGAALMVAVIFIFGLRIAKAGDDIPTKEVIVAINDAYIPAGFDSTTDAYVVVSGLFPNGCYKWKEAEVKHTGTLTHEITSIATVYQGMCIQVLVPYSKDIKLGRLASGKHSLRFLSNDGTYLEKNLVVE